jgi:hypothetical protein
LKSEQSPRKTGSTIGNSKVRATKALSHIDNNANHTQQAKNIKSEAIGMPIHSTQGSNSFQFTFSNSKPIDNSQETMSLAQTTDEHLYKRFAAQNAPIASPVKGSMPNNLLEY